MDPTKLTSPPIPSQATLDAAQNDKLLASLKAAGVGVGSNLANRSLNAPGGDVAQSLLRTLFTGTKATPTATGPARITITKGTVYTAFLPAPYGYVPPEFYGLHPSFTEKELGVRIPGAETLGFRGSQARVDVYNAAAHVEQIKRQINAYRGGVASMVAEANKTTEPLPGLSVQDYLFLKALPPGSTKLQFYVTQYGPKYEALIAQTQADALALLQAASEAGQRAQANYLAELAKRTQPAPGPQPDGTISVGGGGDYGFGPRVAKLTEGFALRMVAANNSKDP